jgi:hypothetical protein
MKIWKEVNVRTGQEIDEDAPTTSVANAPPGMVDEPIVRKKKKKKVLFDGRTKAYKQHREKLEAQREQSCVKNRKVNLSKKSFINIEKVEKNGRNSFNSKHDRYTRNSESPI